MGHLCSMRRHAALSLLLSLVTGALFGQAIQRRNLLMSYGAGVGGITLQSRTEVVKSPYAQAGSIRYAVSYATGDRIAVGYSYERIGSTVHPGLLDRYQVSVHQVQLLMRRPISERSCLEFAAGFGPSISVLSPRGARLQARASSANIGLGSSWMRMFSRTIGLRANASFCTAAEAPLTLEGAPVNDERGEQVMVGWTALSGGIALLVRF
jgi:hypothetical protein